MKCKNNESNAEGLHVGIGTQSIAEGLQIGDLTPTNAKRMYDVVPTQ